MEIIICTWDKCDHILTEKKVKGHCASDFIKYVCIYICVYKYT